MERWWSPTFATEKSRKDGARKVLALVPARALSHISESRCGAPNVGAVPAVGAGRWRLFTVHRPVLSVQCSVFGVRCSVFGVHGKLLRYAETWMPLRNEAVREEISTAPARAVPSELVGAELAAAITTLTGSLSLLDVHGLFIDEHEREYDLEDADFAAARSTNSVVHPETGELVTNAAAHIVPYFVPTDRFYRAIK